MIATCLLLLASAQGTAVAQAPTAQARPADRRAVALARDPRTLVRAPEGRWKDFDPRRMSAADLPPGMAAAREALLAGDLPLAAAELYDALAAEPGFPPALHQLGVVYFRLQRYGDASVVLERFLSEAPHRVGDTRVLGHAYYSLGEYERARAHYERVLAVAPQEVEALRGLALSRLRLGEPERALELLRKVTELEPAHAEAWAWIAQVEFDLERTEEALAACERARDLDPYEPRPWFLLARILHELGRADEAAIAEARHGELAAAVQEIRSVEGKLEYAPWDASLWTRLVVLRRSIGDLAGLQRAIARLAAVRPDDVPSRILALDCLEALGAADAAQRAAAALAEVGAEDADAWKRLEVYHARRGDRAKQLEAGERYRRLLAARTGTAR